MSLEPFALKDKLVVITGGGGLLGRKHAEAIAETGGIPVILDVDGERLRSVQAAVKDEYGISVGAYFVDITDERSLQDTLRAIRNDFGRNPCGLINNAAIDHKFDRSPGDAPKSRLEHFPLDQWQRELGVGLTGAFLCAKIFGTEMAKDGKGVILNVASDLGIIAPDQRIYRKDVVSEAMQEVKPVTYSVIKHGLIGLTKYLATYWATAGVRCNAFAPGGVYNNHPEEFLKKLTPLIPMGRMAMPGEYKSAIQFLMSDASSYMTGAVLVMDGGRTVW